MMAWQYFSRFWDKPEDFLKRQLKENPLYPFKEKQDVYSMEVTNSDLYVGLLVFVLSTAGGIYYWYQQRKFSNELFDAMFVLAFLYSIRLITYNWSRRRIEIERDGEQYYFYVGGKLGYTGKIYNIYLRLRGQKSSNGLTYYRLILNGFNVEEQEITSMTTDKQSIEKLGRLMAGRLNINYFDSDDVSIDHIVRHLNPFSHYLAPSTEKKTTRKTKRVSVTRATLDAFY